MKYLIFFMLFVSCSPKFERELSLKNYLTDVQKIDLEKESFVLFHQTNFCNACSDEAIAIFENQISNNNELWNIILSSNRKDLVMRYTSFENVNMYLDRKFLMEKYGLAMSYDLLFHIKDNKVLNWIYVNEKNLDNVDKFFKKT